MVAVVVATLTFVALAAVELRADVHAGTQCDEAGHLLETRCILKSGSTKERAEENDPAAPVLCCIVRAVRQ